MKNQILLLFLSFSAMAQTYIYDTVIDNNTIVTEIPHTHKFSFETTGKEIMIGRDDDCLSQFLSTLDEYVSQTDSIKIIEQGAGNTFVISPSLEGFIYYLKKKQ